jgi:hypothetical protein
MYHQGSLLPDWESAPKHWKDGSRRGKSRRLLRQEDSDDTTWTQLSILEIPVEQPSYMPEFQQSASWVAATRKVYNIAIGYLNEHQKFSKPQKANGKEAGGEMGLKARGCQGFNSPRMGASLNLHKNGVTPLTPNRYTYV